MTLHELVMMVIEDQLINKERTLGETADALLAELPVYRVEVIEHLGGRRCCSCELTDDDNQPQHVEVVVFPKGDDE